MLNVVEKLSKSNLEITEEQLELFNRCFKNLVGIKRNQGRKIEAFLEKDSLLGNQRNSHLLRIIQNSIHKESFQWSHRIIKVCQNFLNEDSPKNKKSKLFLLKTIADHYRYLYEMEISKSFTSKSNEHNILFTNYDTCNSNLIYNSNLLHNTSENQSSNSNSFDGKRTSLAKVKEAYANALHCAENEKFFPTDMIYLTFFLNYCVFLHDVLEDREEAIKRAKAVLNSALKETEEITENQQKDIILLCQTIKDNLSLWKIEMPEEYN